MLFAMLLLTASPTGSSLLPSAQTTAGPVTGVQLVHAAVFRGIPFAAPPVGDLRWKAPQPPTPWTLPLAADSFGPACPQPAPALSPPPAVESEDCLYLNVWTPELTPAQPAPVMVWIHGGGFTTGWSSQPAYDGEAFAESGVVLVSLNYRLGPFGFLGHPLLSAESPSGVSSNYGLMDQVAGLEWVRDNIAAFGGDAGNVTVFGESAGASSIGCLLTMPSAAKLFDRVILESGHALTIERSLTQTVDNVVSVEAQGLALAKKLGADTAQDPLAAMRAVSAADLLTAATPLTGLFGGSVDGLDKYGPCVDGSILPKPPADAMDQGAFHDVDFLAGANAREGQAFMFALPPIGPLAYKLLIQSMYGSFAPDVLALYPATTVSEVDRAIEDITTLSGFVEPARRLARSMEAPGRAVYLYHFSRVSPGAALFGLGATHAAELTYVFGTQDVAPGFYYGRRDERLSRELTARWAAFAKTGDPNSPGMTLWPAYTQATDQLLEFGDKTQVVGHFAKRAADLFLRIALAP
jgi:para-nitrobenzyl esterase